MTKQLYPFSLFTRIYLGTPQQWPIDPVEAAKSGNGEPVYAQLSSPAQSAPDAPPAISAPTIAASSRPAMTDALSDPRAIDA